MDLYAQGFQLTLAHWEAKLPEQVSHDSHSIFLHYQEILKHLRGLISQAGVGEERSRNLGFMFYAENDISDWQKHLPYKLIQRTLPQMTEISSCLDELETLYPLLKRPAKKQGRSKWQRFLLSYRGGVHWTYFDPNLMGSLASRKMLWKYSDSSDPLLLIRMSTPTQGQGNKIRIVPEFYAYLHWLKSQKKHHTYVNFQDARSAKHEDRTHWMDHLKKVGINDESFRCETIESLTREFPDQFSHLQLSRNNSFYWQTKDFSPDLKGEDFCQLFIHVLMSDEDNGFKLPHRWRQSPRETREILESLFLGLKEFLYPQEFHWNQIQRQDFIEIAYGFLALYCAKGSFSMNLTCKDGIDRAGAAHGMIYLIHLIKEFERSPAVEKRLALLSAFPGMVFSDALSVKHRVLQRNRFHRFLRGARLLLKQSRDFDRLNLLLAFL